MLRYILTWRLWKWDSSPRNYTKGLLLLWVASSQCSYELFFENENMNEINVWCKKLYFSVDLTLLQFRNSLPMRRHCSQKNIFVVCCIFFPFISFLLFCFFYIFPLLPFIFVHLRLFSWIFTTAFRFSHRILSRETVIL